CLRGRSGGAHRRARARPRARGELLGERFDAPRLGAPHGARRRHRALLGQRRRRGHPMTTARASILRQGAAAALLWARFLWHVVLGGTTTAWLIVKPGARAPAGLVWLAYEGLSETGAAVLGCMVS